VEERTHSVLEAYRVNHLLVAEHANTEKATAQGGYGRRQLYELVQNAADELLDRRGGAIKVLLTPRALYCANEGTAITPGGVNAIMMSGLSEKRGDEIGRFGLGFKSVLAITDRPLFLGRSGSFRFDPDHADRTIRSIVPDAPNIPHLRTAVVVDPLQEADADGELAELMSWATTVVELPLDKPRAADLNVDLERFPAEFLLFSPHVGQLRLVDKITGLDRTILARPENDRCLLTKDGEVSSWQLFRAYHQPSEAALEDAGDIARRDKIPVVWAVREGGSRSRGAFWAFFPTTMETTLSGIINAPWKTNSDRQNLLAGVFNEELLDALSDLVVDSLAALMRPDDPGRIFDILPARGREAQSWADTRITTRIYELARRRPSIPDQYGALAMPADLRIAPDDLPDEALELWAAYHGRPSAWCHHSVLTRERRSRVVRLLEDGQVASRRQWLEALASDHTPEASISALRTLDAILSVARPAERQDALRAAIVLTTDGSLVAPDPAIVFSSSASVDTRLAKFIDTRVEADRDAQRILVGLGIGEVDRAGEYALLLDNMDWLFADWDAFWRATSEMEPRRAAILIDEKGFASDLRIRTRAGTWEARSRVLLPGTILTEESTEDLDTLVDTAYHSSTLQVIKELGVASAPAVHGHLGEESWFRVYKDDVFRQYAEATKHLPRKPNVSALILDELDTIGPLEPITRLSQPARARFTSAVLAFEPDGRPWTVRHSSRAEYPVIQVTEPVTWAVKNHGVMETSLGVRTLGEAVGPELAAYSAYLPVAQCTADWAKVLGIATTLSEVSGETWSAALQSALSAERIDGLADLYLAACRIVAAPDAIRCQVGDGLADVAPDQIIAVGDAAQEEVLAEAKVPYLRFRTSADAQSVRDFWSLAAADGIIQSRVVCTPSADPEPIVDAYPGLRAYVPRARRLELIRCSELGRETVGPARRHVRAVEFAVDGDLLYWVDDGNEQRLLSYLSTELHLDLNSDDIDSILMNVVDNRRKDLVAEVRQLSSPGEKLIRLIGRDALMEGIRPDVLIGVEKSVGALDDERLAQLAEAVFGVDLFKEFRAQLEDVSLDPPVAWAGSRAAHRFVADLALPPEYAGFEEPRRSPLWEVDGPADLPKLHEFQEQLTVKIGELALDRTSRRALLSLPTGAGKTRVAVQALVEAYKRGDIAGPILWTAPTVELCEQAVQTWAYVWRAVGPRERLNISRLSESNEAEELTSGLQVVVATDAKMDVVIRKPGYRWLSEASFLVVDEAHGSTESGYTDILHWLGLGPDQRKDRCALLGLTATPFKGTSDEATRRLLARYGRRRLDEGVLGDDPHRKLQAMGVLAQASQRILGGATIELTYEEAETARRTNRLPPKVEEQLSADHDRNAAILGTILSLPDDWKILLFAASVSHAEQMAAILTMRGVAAAAVSAKTNPAARRYYVRQFNNGPLRVLTNYGVLAEGFDAPSVRAVIVGRLTLSPNAYQQMIGRGLRGPKNGGKERCLIVNVADNVLKFGGKLAFEQDFDHLFDETQSDPQT